MNYGYKPTDRDPELAEKISEYLTTIQSDERGQRAYVECNGLYDGVRIRRLTHYPQDQLEQIINVCDAIYETVTHT